MPDGFHWVDIESELTVMAQVRAALRGRKVSAYREVGVKDGYALVFVSERKEEAGTPADDFWSAYSIALDTGKVDLLLSGYEFNFHPWIGHATGELPIDYAYCREDCEGGSLFTTFYLLPKVGWRARWNPGYEYEKGHPIPGVRTDCGEPTGGVDVSPSVFAVFNQEEGGYQVGRWCRTSEVILDHKEGDQDIYKIDPATGKPLLAITDEVLRYSVDPATGKDKEEKLTGAAAREWESRLCLVIPVAAELSWGRDTELCRTFRKAVPDKMIQ